MTAEPGILAIFNDCRAGREAEFEAWFQGEHLLERLSVPGFLFGRRHKAISGAGGYFNFYLVESPEVLTSKPYLERLDHPTPMTHTIMSEVFINMNRTVCRRTTRHGSFRGAFAVTARFNRKQDEAVLSAALKKLTARSRPSQAAKSGSRSILPACRCRWRRNYAAATRRLPRALMIDTLYQDGAETVGAQLARQFPDADIGVFRVLCQIGRSDL